MPQPPYDFRNWGRGRVDPQPTRPTQPSREQFEAAAKMVMESAPTGLSRDQFFALIDHELQKGVTQSALGPQAGIINERGEQVTPERTLPGSDKELNHQWWGGFSKSLGLPSLLEMATIKPSPTGSRMENLESIMPFLLPTTIRAAPSAGREASRMSGEVGEALISRGDRLASQPFWERHAPAAAIGAITRSPTLTGIVEAAQSPTLNRGVGRVFRKMGTPTPQPINDLPLHQQQILMERAGSIESALTGGRSAPPITAGTQNISELPLWKQQMLMDEAGSGAAAMGGTRSQIPRPSNLGRETAPVTPPPRVVGKAPTVGTAIDDALNDIMSEVEYPSTSSAAPDILTAGEGPLRQSGQFGKSQSLGKPGGYSSGRPGVTNTQYDDLLDRMGGRGESDLGRSALEDAPLGAEAAPVSVGGASDAPSLVDALTELDPGAMAGRAQDLRRMKGSRDAAREMFGAGGQSEQDAIRTMAPGPSRMPLEAEDRIRNAMKDPLIGLLMAGMGGRTASSLWEDE